jgi:hypothetical protein
MASSRWLRAISARGRLARSGSTGRDGGELVERPGSLLVLVDFLEQHAEFPVRVSQLRRDRYRPAVAIDCVHDPPEP